MKKLVYFFVATGLFANIAAAQQTNQKKASGNMMECCVMKNGKMVCMKDGKQIPMSHEMTMNDMTVMPDGTCKMKNGKTMKLKEGQCCDKKGKIHSDCAK